MKMKIEDFEGRIICADCMDVLRLLPDGAVDLLLTDPPYGSVSPEGFASGSRFGGWVEGRCSGFKRTMAGGGSEKSHWKYGNEMLDWDIAPAQEVFDEMFRVSKQQVIWGGNYFNLPPCRCFNIWRKTTIPEQFSMAMVEFAWTSFNANAKLWEFPSINPDRFHPTQKPLGLIIKQLEEYSKPGDLVLDCFGGSGTTAIACHRLGRRFICIEKNKIYADKAQARLDAERAQMQLPLFDAPQPTQAEITGL